MAKKRKYLTITIVIILVIGLLYVGYRFHKAYRNVEVTKQKLGYKTPSKNLPTQIFKRGKWQGIIIDADIVYTDGAHNLIPYDLDNDGKVDLIANSYRSDALIVYKYDSDSHDFSKWQRDIIDTSVGGGIPRKPIVKFVKSILKEKLLGGYLGGAHYTAIADMNNDGKDDLIVAGDYKRYDIVCYIASENITNLIKWNKKVIYKNNSHRTYHVETGDIDNDGYQDVVFSTKTDNSIGWCKNNRSSSEWPVTWVDKNCTRCFNVRVADIDKNGQKDIISSEDDSTEGGKIHFYSYLNNPMLQENWINHTIANFPEGHGVSVFEIIDIDNDDDLDIITGNHQGDIFILENTYPDNIYKEWNKYRVNNYNINNSHDFREIDIGDIDGDGDLDIIVADESENMVIWFENSGNTFDDNWKEHVIDKSDQYLKWCHSVELGDIDLDGKIDVAVAAAGSNTFIIYLNKIN